MLKPIVVASSSFRTAQQQADETVVNNVFKVMHGCYGNLFLSKFASGVTDVQGRDKGVASARTIWAFSLRRFDEATVVKALEQCQARHPEFPPSLPQFVQLCAASEPRTTFSPPINRIGMSGQLRSQYARSARAINAKHAERKERLVTGFVPLSPGLDGLKQALANAVGAAGGNEAAELARLDRLYPTEAT